MNERAPHFKLDGVEIPVVDQYYDKFLGVIFDRKLSFIPHINYWKAKCHKALQLLRDVAHTDWGADKSTLLKLYKLLVRSKLDYGCFIYGSASLEIRGERTVGRANGFLV